MATRPEGQWPTFSSLGPYIPRGSLGSVPRRGVEAAVSTGRMARGQSEIELSSQEPGRKEAVDISVSGLWNWRETE